MRDVLRERGTPFAELDLGNARWSDDELLDFVAQHPMLLNRPIVVTPLGTRLCRPAERVLEILPAPPPRPFTEDDGQMADRNT